MDKRGNDPLQEELRSSQVYKTLKGSGIPMAGKLAEGLGKAAQGLDQALNLGRGPGQAQGGHPYQAPPQQSAYRPPQNTTQTRQAPPPSGRAGRAEDRRPRGEWLLPLQLPQKRAGAAASPADPAAGVPAPDQGPAPSGGQPGRCRQAGRQTAGSRGEAGG